MPFPRAQSLIWRYGAKLRKRTRSLKFLRQKERRGKWLGQCVEALTLCNIRKFIFKSSCQFPFPAVVCFARRRLLGLHRRSFRTPGCRSGINLHDLAAKKDCEEMLANKWRLGTDEDTLVLRLNVQANFPEQRRAQAGPLTGYIAMRSPADWSISGLLQKRATANPFTRASCYSWSSKGNTSATVWQKKSGAYHTAFNH